MKRLTHKQRALNSALIDALYALDSPKIKQLLDQGADPNIKIRTAMSWSYPNAAMRYIRSQDGELTVNVDPLAYWIQRYFYAKSDTAIFYDLLKAGANIKVSHAMGDEFKLNNPIKALIDAYNHLELLEDDFYAIKTELMLALIKHGADPCEKYQFGNNVLHVCMFSGRASKITWLGSMPEFKPYFERMMLEKNLNGNTPMSELCHRIDTSNFSDEFVFRACEPYVRYGIDIFRHVFEKKSLTYADFLIEAGYVEVVRRLTAIQSRNSSRLSA